MKVMIFILSGFLALITSSSSILASENLSKGDVVLLNFRVAGLQSYSLGEVDTINEDELAKVLTHEFGSIEISSAALAKSVDCYENECVGDTRGVELRVAGYNFFEQGKIQLIFDNGICLMNGMFFNVKSLKKP